MSKRKRKGSAPAPALTFWEAGRAMIRFGATWRAVHVGLQDVGLKQYVDDEVARWEKANPKPTLKPNDT